MIKKNNIIMVLLIILMSVGLVYAEGITSIKTIMICDDVAEWPPYSYYSRHEGTITKNIEGFSIDVIQEILSKHNLTFSIDLLPWKRCQLEVERGNRYYMLLSARYSEERAEKYYISRPYYMMNHIYFYSAKKYPDGLMIKDMEDIKQNYKICGIFGYSYDFLGLTPEDLDQDINYYKQLIQILHRRPERCDLFIEGYEVFVGFKAIGEDYLSDQDLKYAPIPGVEASAYHIMISKKFQYGKELLDIIDTGITELEQSGRLKELLDKYELSF